MFSKRWSRPSAAGVSARKARGAASLTFAVEALRDLETAILPFFEEYRLRREG